MNKIFANENFVSKGYEENIINKEKIERNLKEIIEELGFDLEDQNLKDTPKRITKMWVEELFKGCYEREPNITIFENNDCDEMVICGPINLKSTCSHHLVGFLGECYIGYIPNKKICGLSKLARITYWFMRRPQIQEELTSQIANYIQEKLEPLGVGVIIKAKHHCMSSRGVNEENSNMITSKLLGCFREIEVRQEFMNLIKDN